MKSRLQAGVLVLLCLCAVRLQSQASSAFAADYLNQDLYRVDLTTAHKTLIGHTGTYLAGLAQLAQLIPQNGLLPTRKSLEHFETVEQMH
jgi:hypothetical protein